MTDADARWQEWRDLHQVFEWDWWKDALKNRGHSQDPWFSKHWGEVRDWIKPEGQIIDIGCGPRPPFAPCTVIEPLAEKYKSITPQAWWNGVTAYSQPAEQIIDGLKGDTIICWNCIDHCADWRGVLDAMLAYENPGARFAIATDFHKPFLGHPGVGGSETFMPEIDRRFKIIKQNQGQEGWRELSLLMTAR